MKGRKGRNSVIVLIALSAAMIWHVTIAEVAAQVSSRRGISSRGMSPVGSRSSGVMNTMRPTYGPTYGMGANAGGPLNFGYVPNLGGPVMYFDSSAFAPLGDSTLQGNIGSQGDMSSQDAGAPAGFRPTIRPRLDISDRDAMNSNGILKNIRDVVLEQVARCPEKPFTPEWYSAHGSVVPARTKSGNSYYSSSWDEVKEWVGLDAQPQRYDFRPDERGLIFVYQDDVARERAVRRTQAGHATSHDCTFAG